MSLGAKRISKSFEFLYMFVPITAYSDVQYAATPTACDRVGMGGLILDVREALATKVPCAQSQLAITLLYRGVLLSFW